MPIKSMRLTERMAVDISKYLTAEEIGEYVDAYIEEGRFDGSEGIKVFPVAKSTEVFAINKTDWDKFAEATGRQTRLFPPGRNHAWQRSIINGRTA